MREGYTMDISVFVKWIQSLEVKEWIVLVTSLFFALKFFCIFFMRNVSKIKCIVYAIASLTYGYIFLLIVDSTYFLNTTKGHVFLGVVNLLIVITFSLADRSFGFDSLVAGAGIALTQLVVLVPVAFVLWVFYTLADSVYKDDVYSSMPYYRFFQFVVFALSLAYQIFAAKYDGTTSKDSEETKRVVNNNATSSSQSAFTVSTVSTSAQASAHSEFLQKQLDGTLTPEERDKYDREWS